MRIIPKISAGNLWKGNNKYLTIGAATLFGIGAAWILKRMIKEGPSPVNSAMVRKAMRAYARPALVSEQLGLGNQGGNWLAVPYIENKNDKHLLNRLPTLATNVVGFPLNENNFKFIGGTGFGACDGVGKFALTR